MMTNSSGMRDSQKSIHSRFHRKYPKTPITSRQPVWRSAGRRYAYEKKVFLKNGTQLHIRPIRISDLADFQQFFGALSSESKFYRFGLHRLHLTSDCLVQLCRMDFDRDFTFLAVIQDKTKEIVGNLQLNRLVDYDNGELSFLIADGWQGKGIGSRLMEFSLIIAKRIRLKTLLMQVMEDNEKMKYLASKFNFRQQQCLEDEYGDLLLELMIDGQ